MSFNIDTHICPDNYGNCNISFLPMPNCTSRHTCVFFLLSYYHEVSFYHDRPFYITVWVAGSSKQAISNRKAIWWFRGVLNLAQTLWNPVLPLLINLATFYSDLESFFFSHANITEFRNVTTGGFQFARAASVLGPAKTWLSDNKK